MIKTNIISRGNAFNLVSQKLLFGLTDILYIQHSINTKYAPIKAAIMQYKTNFFI